MLFKQSFETRKKYPQCYLGYFPKCNRESDSTLHNLINLIYVIRRQYWYEQPVLQSVVVRRSTGNDVIGQYFHHYFSFFFFLPSSASTSTSTLLKAEMAVFSINPATRPAGRPPGQVQENL